MADSGAAAGHCGRVCRHRSRRGLDVGACTRGAPLCDARVHRRRTAHPRRRVSRRPAPRQRSTRHPRSREPHAVCLSRHLSVLCGVPAGRIASPVLASSDVPAVCMGRRVLSGQHPDEHRCGLGQQRRGRLRPLAPEALRHHRCRRSAVSGDRCHGDHRCDPPQLRCSRRCGAATPAAMGVRRVVRGGRPVRGAVCGRCGCGGRRLPVRSLGLAPRANHRPALPGAASNGVHLRRGGQSCRRRRGRGSTRDSGICSPGMCCARPCSCPCSSWR